MPAPLHPTATVRSIGCVVIGRNEGPRLERCLRSLIGGASIGAGVVDQRQVIQQIIYVDSGSTDDSVRIARSLGVEVFDLDVRQPFTAARARNAGLERLLREKPDIEFVQFVDGDCEVVAGWIERAAARLIERADLACVCGRRRERFPEASIYNRLCDLEWSTPIGDVATCGGDAMMRTSALAEVNAFNAELIGGEEPELCLRLRARGWKIERLDAEMTLHDAAMTHFSQWWKRSVRTGYAYAEGVSMYGASPEHYRVREARRVWLFGAVVPIAAVGAALPTLGGSLLLFGGYPAVIVRTFRFERRLGRAPVDAFLYALNSTATKFPELQGMLRFHFGRLTGRRSGLIEYKAEG